MRINLFAAVALAVCLFAGCNKSMPAAAPESVSPQASMQPLSWGDQGDGTYKNPILNSDYSDPDIIRVGDDFYLVASDFHFVGIQVLHSKDLVNWEVINQVFNRLPMSPKYDQNAGYGQGTWAPSLRYHDGQFYLFVCTPFDGLFMWHTADLAGKWSEMVTVKAVEKWEDPCPLWDDDGQAYLVHSIKGAGPFILHKMSPDGTHLLDDGKQIYSGVKAEGPKFYKRHGYYYISFPEGGVNTGGQAVIRARNIYGPYEHREVLPAGSPHQGGIVDLDNGESWFIGFKNIGFLGRVSFLQPVKWGEDDWPVFGDHGQPVTAWKKPNVGRDYPVSRPAVSDEFESAKLSPIWQWNHNPVNEKWSFAARPGWLRLTALPAEKISLARNTLTEKLWDQAGIIDTRLDISHLADGQVAGLTFISGDAFGFAGVTQSGGVRYLMWDAAGGPVVHGSDLYLRGYYEGEIARFAYSFDGKSFTEAGSTFRLKFANWKGARFGVFTYGPTQGWIDVDYIHYKYNNSLKDMLH